MPYSSLPRRLLERTETVSTVRAYFMFFGLIYILMYHDPAGERHGISWLSLAGLLQGIVYVSVGLALRALLSRAVWLIESVLAASLCHSVLTAFSRLSTKGAEYSPAEVIYRLVCAIFLILYVFRNVERLATAERVGVMEPGSVAPESTGSRASN